MQNTSKKLIYQELVVLFVLYIIFTWLTTSAVRNNTDYLSIWGIILAFSLFLAFGSIFVGIYCFFKYLIKKEGRLLKKSFVCLTVIPILIIMPILIGKNLHKKDLVTTLQEAENVVSALEEYHYKNDEYPENLSNLEPQYLAKIPIPKVGFKKQFIYHKQSRHNYWLGFYSTDTRLCEYEKEEGTWGCK